jgi:hypothetical protein
VGFITARLVSLHQTDATDRSLMGLTGRALDAEKAVYILTLGMAKGFRQQVGACCGYGPCSAVPWAADGIWQMAYGSDKVASQ